MGEKCGGDGKGDFWEKSKAASPSEVAMSCSFQWVAQSTFLFQVDYMDIVLKCPSKRYFKARHGMARKMFIWEDKIQFESNGQNFNRWHTLMVNNALQERG